MTRAFWLFLMTLAAPAGALAQATGRDMPASGGIGWIVILAALAVLFVIYFGGLATFRRRRRMPRGPGDHP